MFTGWKRTLVLVAAALAVGLLGVGLTTAAKPNPSAPPPQVSYDIVWIDGLGDGKFTKTGGMNSYAAVVGLSKVVGGQDHAFLNYVNRSGQRVTVDLNALNDPNHLLAGWGLSGAVDINDSFQIAGWGYYQVDPQTRKQSAYRLSLKLATDGYPEEDENGNLTVSELLYLGTLPGSIWEAAFGINESGDVCGDWGTEGNFHHGFLWTEERGMEDIGALDGAWGIYTAAINDDRQITGYADVPKGYHAIRYTPDVGIQDLGFIGLSRGGYEQSWGRDIDFSGAVVGKSSAGTKGKSNVFRAFRYTDATGMVDLGTLGGQNSSAQAINSFGDIVGVADKADGTEALFLLPANANQMAEVVVKDPQGSLTIQGPSDINDLGVICGTGSKTGVWGEWNAYLLIPSSQ